MSLLLLIASTGSLWLLMIRLLVRFSPSSLLLPHGSRQPISHSLLVLLRLGDSFQMDPRQPCPFKYYLSIWFCTSFLLSYSVLPTFRKVVSPLGRAYASFVHCAHQLLKSVLSSQRGVVLVLVSLCFSGAGGRSFSSRSVELSSRFQT